MFPIVFSQAAVCGGKDEAVKFTENHCSFNAEMNEHMNRLRKCQKRRYKYVYKHGNLDNKHGEIVFWSMKRIFYPYYFGWK